MQDASVYEERNNPHSLSSLARAATILNGACSPLHIANIAWETLSCSRDYAGFALWTWSSKVGFLRVLGHGFSQEELTSFETRLSQPGIKEALSAGNMPEMPEAAPLAYVRPLLCGAGLVGAIALQDVRGAAPDQDLKDWLAAWTAIVAGALHRVQECFQADEDRQFFEESQAVARLGSWTRAIGGDEELTWSRQVCSLFGVPDSGCPRTLQDFYNQVHPEDRERVQAAAVAASNGGVYDIEHRIVRPDGVVRWVLERGEAIQDSSGKPVRRVGIVQDITDRKEAEARLREGEETFRKVVENADGVFWVADSDLTRMIYVSPAYEKIWGEPCDSLYANPKSFLRLIHPEDRQRVEAAIAAYRRGAPYDEVFRIITKNGDVRWIRDRGIAIPSTSGGEWRFSGLAQDITDHKRAEAELQEKLRLQDQLTDVAATVPGLIYSFKLGDDGTISMPYASGVAGQVFGHTAEDLKRDASPVFRLIHPDDLAGLQASIANSARSLSPWKNEFRIMHPTAGEIWVEGNSVPHRVADGTLWHGFVQDITARKQGLAALTESERRLRQMMTNIQLVAVMLDENGKVLFANKWLGLLTGWDPSELEGKDWFDVCIPKEHLAEVRAIFNRMRQGDVVHHFENAILTRSGERRLVAWNNTEMRDLAGRVIGISSIGEDVTQRRAAEVALQESANRFRKVLEAAPEGICVQMDGKFTYANRPAAGLFGADSVDQLIGTSVFERVHADSRSAAALHFAEQGRHTAPTSPVDLRMLRLDGSAFDAEVSTTQLVFNGKPASIVFFRDVTERKRIGLQLRQAQKMDAVGQLAGGVAHDFNNILAVILMQIGLLNSNPALGGDVREALKEVEDATSRAIKLTRQLLLFSRQEMVEARPLDLDGLAKNHLKMLRRLMPENIEIRYDGWGKCLWIKADAGMIEQVVMNLCINARDAMPKGGSLLVATSAIEFSDNIPNRNVKPGLYARLSVVDQGCGMDEQTLHKIFEPFFTTKGVGQGTGLGLATVYGIVKQHGGWLDVHSKVGKGSEFHVYLPAMISTPAEEPRAPLTAISVRGTETVLLVEDEDSVRKVASAYLRRLGYTVVEANNADTALVIWREMREKIHLILTDMIMPGRMTGLDLAEAVWKEDRRVPVIISSGYNTELQNRHTEEFPCLSKLPKPYTAAVLAKAIKDALETRKTG